MLDPFFNAGTCLCVGADRGRAAPALLLGCRYYQVVPVLPRPLTEDVSGVQRQRDAINVVSDPRVEHRVQVPPWMLLQNRQVGERYSNLGLQ